MLSGASNACNKKLSQRLFGEAGTPRIAIIGGGFGGIGLGVKLVEAGIDTFTIFEKNETFGGTWWENTYPGAEVDSPSYLYSYSFRPYDWSRNLRVNPSCWSTWRPLSRNTVYSSISSSTPTSSRWSGMRTPTNTRSTPAPVSGRDFTL